MTQQTTFYHRVLPHPFVSLIVVCSWMMLAHSAAPVDIFTGLLLGLIIPKLIQPFIVHTPNIQWMQAIKLFFVVLYDIIISNLRVAKQDLGPTKNLHPKWYRVPLDTDHEHVNTLLAMIITTTPGTVSAGIDQERGDILVHALSSDDPESEILDIKQRYEQPLITIFNVQNGEAE